jgi:SAM-dependent methyltransferase
VDGYVAHVTGDVESEEKRQHLRTLLRQQAGLYAVWDLLTLPGQQLAVVDVGCGGQKQRAWAIGVDRLPHPGVDVVANLEEQLPFEDDSFDHIFAIHILEHIHDLLALMREMHRILRSSGVLHVLTPHWRHVNAVADPTHCRFMDSQTFKYFCSPTSEVLPWRPLMVTASEDTVFADLQPIKTGMPPTAEEIARWFH